MAEDQPIAVQPKRPKATAALIALVGAATAYGLIADTNIDEGVKYHEYRDLGGVISICAGDTHNVRPGEVDTPAQCDERTAAQLLQHAQIVIGCVPALRQVGRENQLRAATRFDDNTGRFCNGSVGRLMKVGNWRAGCNAMTLYDKVIGTRPVPGAMRVTRASDGRYVSEIRGLYNRRLRERAQCLTGLPA